MSLESKFKLVSGNCFGGRLVPQALQILWKAFEEGDSFIETELMLKLLSSLEVLGYAHTESFAKGDSGILASIHADQRIFKRLGFFAECPNGQLLAFDFEAGSPLNPPVIELDTEGDYRWVGIELEEALSRVAEDMGKTQETAKWMQEHGMSVRDWGQLGSTTQFLPSLAKLHDDLWYEILGELRPRIPSSDKPCDPSDLFTWLLRPGEEVCRAIQTLLSLPVEKRPTWFMVWCDGEGRVTNVELPNIPEAQGICIQGVKLGMPRLEVLDLLGEPSERGDKISWIAYRLARGRLHLSFKNEKIVEIHIGLNS